MGGLLIKPYEISVWDDRLTQIEGTNPAEYKFEEVKLAVIGSNTMEGPNKVYEPVFNKKSNGEKTLSFSLKYKYFDPYNGNSEVINPFAALLVNERKIKLHYDDEWYEFIIKDHTESSDEYTWTYTCTDAFVLELSKNGYNLTFDAELNNNQGTARELVQKTIQDTDWRLGGVDKLRQLIEEPLYKATLVSVTDVTIINATGDTEPIPAAGTQIYVFYSYVKNKDGKFIQFIIRDNGRNYVINENNVINDTNYRITTELTYRDNGFYLNNNLIISIGEVEKFYQGYRLAYNQLTTYDSVMGRTVDRYKVGDREVYKYTDYTYTTSNVVLNYITNGDNFNALEDGTLQGWNPYVEFSPHPADDKIVKLELKTKPELSSGKELADISTLSQIEGFLKANLKGPRVLENNEYKNAIFNSGFENNAAILGAVSQGQEFLFRWRANEAISEDAYKKTTDTSVQQGKSYYTRTGDGSQNDPYTYTSVENPNNSDIATYFEKYTNYVLDINQNHPAEGLRAMVAKYTQDEATRYGFYYKHIDANNVIIDFNLENGDTVQTLNNYVDGGVLEPVYVLTSDTEIVDGKQYYIKIEIEGEEPRYEQVQEPDSTELPNYYELTHHNYVIDGVVQAPSTKYIYRVGDVEYTYSIEIEDFVQGTTNYLPYYYIKAVAKEAISEKELRNTDTDQDTRIGIFIYTTDNTVEGQELYYFIQDIQISKYIEDANGEPVIIGNIPTATSTSTDYYYLKPENGQIKEDIQTYTTSEDLLNALDITGADLEPLYNEDSEKVLSISESKSNCFNILQSIAETFECWIDLVVEHDARGYIQYENGKPLKWIYLKEYVGKDNFAGFKYGVNLDSIERNFNSDEIVTKMIVDQSQSEYTDSGFVSIASSPSNPSGESYILNFDYYYNQGLLDREKTEEEILNFDSQVKDLNLELQEWQIQQRDLEAALIELGSKRNVYGELLNAARNAQTQALSDFYYLTKKEYEDYRKNHTILPELDQLTEAETILDTLTTLYVSSSQINNYSGLYTNVDQEYLKKRKELKGSENYTVKLWVGFDELQERHIFVEVSDYLIGFKFKLTNDADWTEIDLSHKYFDITDNESQSIIFNIENLSEYHFDIEGEEESREFTHEINNNEIYRFSIICAETIKGVEDYIEELQTQKDELTKEFNNKFSRFIQEGTWSSTDYIDSELYYLDALQVSNTSAQPTGTYTIKVVEISQLEGFKWYSFNVGDKTYVEDTEFFGWASVNGNLTPAREEVIVSEVEWHLDEPDKNTITVQNYKTRFEDLFQRINATVQTVQYNEATYAKISSVLDANGTINQNVLLESLNNISGREYNLTTDGSIQINGDEILIHDVANTSNYVRINSEGVQISSDGSNWITALGGRGIDIGTVYTGTLNTDQVIIGNSENPSFRWDREGISAYKQKDVVLPTRGLRAVEPDDSYDLKTFVRFDQFGLYGVENNATFKATSLDDILQKAHFAVTWNGFFIKNNYVGGGRVEITSDNDFRILKDVGGTEKEVIKIGALEWNGSIIPDKTVSPSLYGIRITNDDDVETFKTDNYGNIKITGTINATGGNFSDLVTVGKNTDQTSDYVIIDGVNASIQSSNYNGGVSTNSTCGWIINKDGDAVFNNITARGAIKTAVFEYAEIQAVGGVLIFRPSSTIRSAAVDGNDLVLTVEKPVLFIEGNWCKISNYTARGQADNPDVDITDNEESAQDILQNNGLSHIYQISDITTTSGVTYITLDGAAAMVGVNAAVTEVGQLIGGALIDMGNSGGTSNYGIGINSSDNTIDLPARAISLFETTINSNGPQKVEYNYRGILGTLPSFPVEQFPLNSIYASHLAGTQGIYTDNMYIGDNNQYIAFYTYINNEENTKEKKLRIRAQQIEFETINPDTHNPEWKDIADIEAEGIPGLEVSIHSTLGERLVNGQGAGAIYVRVVREENEIDSIGDVEPQVGETLPNNQAQEGDRFILINPTNKVATLYIYENNNWSPMVLTATYEWTFRDKNNAPITNENDLIAKFGNSYDSNLEKVVGKCLYIDHNVIDNKLIASVKVTINENEE